MVSTLRRRNPDSQVEKKWQNSFIAFIPVFFFIVSLSVNSYSAALQITAATGADREELLKLLQERSVMFNRYSASEKQKSGFFGQRTKNDMKESQEHLKEIITQDNRIISSLNRILDYRNFEKITRSYDANRDIERLRSLTLANDTLLKQVLQLETQSRELKSAVGRNKILVWGGWLVAAVIFWMYYKRKKAERPL